MSDKTTGGRLGELAGTLPALWLASIRMFFVGFWRRVKGGKSLGESLIVAGYKLKMRRKGDAIVNVIYEDGVVKPRPATYHSDESYFETDNDERFSARGIGYNPRRMAGKVPVVYAMRVGSEVTEPLEPAISRARRLGAYDQYETAAGDEDMAVNLDPTAIHNGQDAVADGGETPMTGLAISFREGYEMFGSKVTNEELNQAEKRGKLAALDFAESDTWKWILAILGAAALGMFGPAVASSIAGGASSATSSGVSLPIMLGVLPV